MNFFKLYIGDYQRDTAHLSVTEHGAYLLMLQHYYATEKPLPVGKALHRMLRAQDKAERDAIDSIVAQFWTETPAGLVNARSDVEIAKAAAQAGTNRVIAQEREAKRKAARTEHESCTNRATNDQPNQTPNTRHQVTPPTPTGVGLSRFAEFWDAWPRNPRKAAKAQCERKWRSRGLDHIADRVMAALTACKASKDWTKDGGQFVPAPLVWLNQSRWEAPTEADAAAEQQAQHWHETRSGIEAKGEELGLGRWDQRAFELGAGEPWPVYQARVYRRAGFTPRAAA